MDAGLNIFRNRLNRFPLDTVNFEKLFRATSASSAVRDADVLQAQRKLRVPSEQRTYTQ